MTDDYEPTPGFADEIQRVLDSIPTPQPAPPTDEKEAARQRWLAPAQPSEPNPAPPVGTSPLARQLEDEGWFARREAENAAETEQARQRAIEESAQRSGIPFSMRDYAQRLGVREPERPLGNADSATRRFLSELPGNAYVVGSQIPGGAVGMVGTTLQGGAVADPVEAIAANAQRYIADLQRVPQMSAQELSDFRRRVEQDPAPLTRTAVQSAISDLLDGSARMQDVLARFAPPTPVAQRPLYQAGEAVQEYGRNLVPLPQGYTEQSVSTQLGRGLGSMIAGLPVAYFLGPVGAGAFYGASGMGEATQNAVQFDQAERAAGRPGLTQEQIVLAGILGFGPGITDIVPVEVMLHQLRLPGMTPQAARGLARAIAGVGARVVFQTLIEGSQEAFQQVLQNVIAWSVYNPNQDMTADVWWNGIIGGGVGAIAQGGQEVGRGLLGAVGRRGGRGASHPIQPPPTMSPADEWAQADREARARTGGVRTDVTPAPAPVQPETVEQRDARLRETGSMGFGLAVVGGNQ